MVELWTTNNLINVKLTAFNNYKINIAVQQNQTAHMQLPSVHLNFKFLCWMNQRFDPEKKLFIPTFFCL